MRFNNPFDHIEPEVLVVLPPTVARVLPQEVFERLDLLTQASSTPLGLVVILRGVPGIGKSTLAKKIWLWCEQNNLSCCICNADIWMVEANGYNWDRYELTNADNHCKSRFMLAMAAKTNVIVIDNTNLDRTEYKWYEDHLDADNYEAQCIEIDCEDIRAARLAIARSHVGAHYNITEALARFHADREDRDPQHWIIVQPTSIGVQRFANNMIAQTR
jgi:hypothetical protein